MVRQTMQELHREVLAQRDESENHTFWAKRHARLAKAAKRQMESQRRNIVAQSQHDDLYLGLVKHLGQDNSLRSAASQSAKDEADSILARSTVPEEAD